MPETQPEEKKGHVRSLTGFRGHIVSVLALGMARFQFYTAYRGAYTPMVQRGIHLEMQAPVAR